MRKHFTRASQVGVDLAVFAVALTLAFLVRFDWAPPHEMIARMFFVLPYVLVAEYGVLLSLGVHRFAWRYVGLRETARIFLMAVVITGLLALARLVAGYVADAGPVGHPRVLEALTPFGVVAINFPLVFLGTTGVRVLRRLLAERARERAHARNEQPRVPTMLIGAGQAGVLVARELTAHADIGMQPVGFLDDDNGKVGSVVHGVPVLGTTARLAELCARVGAQQVLITMASAPGKEVRRIRQLCDDAGLPVKIIPGLYEIVGGQVNLERIRDVAIEDLLRREPVALDLDAIAKELRGTVILVTGAGGSIGSEICRQVCSFAPKKLVLVERAENALFEIHRELLAAYPGVPLVPFVADVGDEPRMGEAFEKHAPRVVFHAAAHKHVPMMETNPGEAVKNNIVGTRTVAQLARRHETDVFVMISTDKAVNPSSVMGASKRVAEQVVQALSQGSATRFVTVRFGNVLGSAGSVVPIFRQQIARGGPVTVTHPDMKRFFMTIPEACQLVLQAGSMGSGGEIFILDMGEPVKIVDLARDLIGLCGLREGEDIEIQFTGVRPGEKLYEELSTDAENADKTRHPKIFTGRIRPQTWEAVSRSVEALVAAAASENGDSVRRALCAAVPEYTPDGLSTTAPAAARSKQSDEEARARDERALATAS